MRLDAQRVNADVLPMECETFGEDELGIDLFPGHLTLRFHVDLFDAAPYRVYRSLKISQTASLIRWAHLARPIPVRKITLDFHLDQPHRLPRR